MKRPNNFEKVGGQTTQLWYNPKTKTILQFEDIVDTEGWNGIQFRFEVSADYKGLWIYPVGDLNFTHSVKVTHPWDFTPWDTDEKKGNAVMGGGIGCILHFCPNGMGFEPTKTGFQRITLSDIRTKDDYIKWLNKTICGHSENFFI